MPSLMQGGWTFDGAIWVISELFFFLAFKLKWWKNTKGGTTRSPLLISLNESCIIFIAIKIVCGAYGMRYGHRLYTVKSWYQNNFSKMNSFPFRDFNFRRNIYLLSISALNFFFMRAAFVQKDEKKLKLARKTSVDGITNAWLHVNQSNYRGTFFFGNRSCLSLFLYKFN